MLVLTIALGMFSCEKESINTTTQETSFVNESPKIEDGMFSFDDWQEFRDLYNKFAELDTEQLISQSFYRYDKGFETSPAILGILNDDNQFIVTDKIIWFNEGKFYELEDDRAIDFQKSNMTNLREVGSVSYSPVNVEGSDSSKSSVVLSNQHRFNKQRYVEDCGSGKVQGPSPRQFKYVHEVYHELLVTPAPLPISQFSLWLRVKLEYNHKRRKWRHSGEGREISININNNSFLENNRPYPDDYNRRSVVFSSDCATHQVILLNRVTVAAAPYNSHWNINVSGTITEKMLGDVEGNRWKDEIYWD